ncbi:helix-turn-helix transcriptional regulator [Serratia marcescens]|uniref:helix-turn-helix transcriptional regulator n=1 Tax=Serratia marcescens TaxID=615 RepID=UPI00148E1872|nr:helix-turn-helix transcriptional regulator [Serratia marcescens]QJU38088.1 LuxR family transcriptional regulator [Serratia marcescens]
MVYIALLGNDAFISQGLMFFLSDYFRIKKKKVEFVNQSRLAIADVIFYDDSRTMACLIGDALRAGMKDCVIFSLYDGKPSLAMWRLGRLQKTLSKRGDLQQLRFYLDALWHERKIPAVGKVEASEKEVLTTRQRQIMCLLAKGIAPADISMRLNISIKTVSSHRGAVMKKFGFNRKIELYNWLILRGNEL